MNPQFEALCEKLGVAAEELWPLLVERTILDAKIGIVFFSFWIVVFFALVTWSIIHDKKEDDGASIWGVLLGVPLIALSSVVLYLNILNLMYPEVAALKSLIN